MCVIGQICLTSRSAYLGMFSTTIVAMASEAFNLRVTFSNVIYIIAKYCIAIMIDLVSRVKHMPAGNSDCEFLDPKVEKVDISV